MSNYVQFVYEGATFVLDKRFIIEGLGLSVQKAEKIVSLKIPSATKTPHASKTIWTEEKLATLRLLKEGGYSTDHISTEMGCSKSAIINACAKFKIKKKRKEKPVVRLVEKSVSPAEISQIKMFK